MSRLAESCLSARGRGVVVGPAAPASIFLSVELAGRPGKNEPQSFFLMLMMADPKGWARGGSGIVCSWCLQMWRGVGQERHHHHKGALFGRAPVSISVPTDGRPPASRSSSPLFFPPSAPRRCPVGPDGPRRVGGILPEMGGSSRSPFSSRPHSSRQLRRQP